jgi:transposase-like protein
VSSGARTDLVRWKTYVGIAAKWAYLYRAVDSADDTIDFMLSPNSDLTTAKFFLHARYPEPVPCGRG